MTPAAGVGRDHPAEPDVEPREPSYAGKDTALAGVGREPGYPVAARARSRTPAVVSAYMSSVTR